MSQRFLIRADSLGTGYFSATVSAYRFVAGSADLTSVGMIGLKAGTSSTIALGVVQDTMTTGVVGSYIKIENFAEVTLELTSTATVTVGTILGCGAGGKAVQVKTNTYAYGIALQAGYGTSTKYIKVRLISPFRFEVA